ncbi:MAG: glucose/galactose MFS transporter [Agriterribacter sp.]
MPKESAARRIGIMGICNKGAGILAPLIFAAIILRPTDTELFRSLPLMNEVEKNAVLDELIRRVIWPYFIVGIVLTVLGLFVRYSPLPEINTDEDDNTVHSEPARKNIFQFPHLILGAVAIFLHVGTQVIAIDTIINYAGSFGISLLEAKTFPSYTLAATICGYLTGIALIPKILSQLTVLRICVILGLCFSLFIIYARGSVQLLGHQADVSIWFLVLLGLANSMVWAGIWPLALDGLGRFTKLGASVMIMGLCGNALLPLVYGYFADLYSLRSGYWVLIPCYLYLIFYSFRGYHVKQWNL